ncbi:DUF262 domain-containing protein [Corallococcus llansteffanensis]|uniref:DUF262 domain-containing protein n=1 Tax=Corallococcus llansteffanensis TaxID=2316731 RepID=A0A3A8QGF1_9BACT|nr:DUF262 domain-containing protein [Corallococcus llansteffanensis]RKH67038.1 DUF262 domain-containing protein [Corallococcus llansteffanensis]
MTTETIKGTEALLHKVFSDDFAFEIPEYQRPYAWKQQQADELLLDLIGALGSTEASAVGQASPYFLGSIVLIEKEKAKFEVVDGQQRLTTLTILLSALRHVITAPRTKAAISLFLQQEGNEVLGTLDRPRLKLRQQDASFFKKYIQEKDGLSELLKLQTRPETEAQENIRANAQHLVTALSRIAEADCQRLVSYIAQRCFLVIVSTSNLDSAFRIFSVLNDRGLDLAVSDIIKAELLGRLHASDPRSTGEYQHRWETLENDLGRDRFQTLFNHIRMIHARKKLKGTVLAEFREYVLKGTTDVGAFLDQNFFKYGQAFETILQENYQGIDEVAARKVNAALRWFSYVDNTDWLPPAILFLKKHSNNPELLVEFFQDLERLAACFMFLRPTINVRLERYAQVLEAIERNGNLREDSSPLQLTSEERREALQVIEGDVYNAYPTVRRLILLRLDSELAAGGAVYDHDRISIEHVVPQTVKPGSEWEKHFPDADARQQMIHRLGNLVLLTRRKNSQASNYDFAIKKAKYFSTVEGVTNFALTNVVLKESSWTHTQFQNRQADLSTRLKNVWRL